MFQQVKTNLACVLGGYWVDTIQSERARRDKDAVTSLNVIEIQSHTSTNVTLHSSGPNHMFHLVCPRYVKQHPVRYNRPSCQDAKNGNKIMQASCESHLYPPRPAMTINTRATLLSCISSDLRQGDHSRVPRTEQAVTHRVRVEKSRGTDTHFSVVDRCRLTLLFLFSISLLQYVVETMLELLQCLKPSFELPEVE
jgi:hypothetical protein